jgi:hypothetical protein
MDDVTRRAALKLAATAGVVLAAGQVGSATAVDDKDKDKDKSKPDPTDRQRVIEAGLTEDEADVWELTAQLAGKFFKLPKLHVMDDHEITHAIHVLQYRLLSRPTYRRYLELSKKGKN